MSITQKGSKENFPITVWVYALSLLQLCLFVEMPHTNYLPFLNLTFFICGVGVQGLSSGAVRIWWDTQPSSRARDTWKSLEKVSIKGLIFTFALMGKCHSEHSFLISTISSMYLWELHRPYVFGLPVVLHTWVLGTKFENQVWINPEFNAITNINSACIPQMNYLFHFPPQNLMSENNHHCICSWSYGSAIWAELSKGVLLGLLT